MTGARLDPTRSTRLITLLAFLCACAAILGVVLS